MADPELTGVFRQPFAEQVAFFRQKLGNLVPTATWRDLMGAQHDRACMVAGAAKADLLADLAAAVDKAITDGESLDAFRARFGEIVQRHGWQGWTGSQSARGIAWRTRVIYRTNAATSYAAGRYAQLAEFPLWVYQHGGSRDPRPQHLAWDGLTLPREHKFWTTHAPPNGWGCRCRVAGASSPAAARRLGGDPSMKLPEGWDDRDGDGRLPGVDEGWDYQPGASVREEVAQSVAKKTVAWPYENAKAFMSEVPAPVRDALATAQRLQPETGVAVRRYAERVLRERNGAPIDPRVNVEVYQTMGLLTTAEAQQLARMTGVEALETELWDWTIDKNAPWHIRGGHGDAATEAPRGQRAITAADYALIPRAIAERTAMTMDGAELKMEWEAPNGERLLMFFAPLKKRRMMLLKSMRVIRAPRTQRP